MSLDPGVHTCAGFVHGPGVTTTCWKWPEGREKAGLSEEAATSHIVSAVPGPRSCVSCPHSWSELFTVPALSLLLPPNSEVRTAHKQQSPGPSCKGCWESKPLHLLLPRGRGTLLPTRSYKEENVPSTEGWGGRDLKEWQWDIRALGAQESKMHWHEGRKGSRTTYTLCIF